MTDPHPLGVLIRAPAAIEAADPRFLVEGLRSARAKTLAVFAEIREALREGMTEDDARKLALETFARHGVRKHWHKPYIRFGAGTALTFHDPLQPEYRLRAGDAAYIDLGPAWPDEALGLEYEGDYGDTFVFAPERSADPALSAAAAKCAETAHRLFAEARDAWREKRLTGRELYALLERRARECGYVLKEKVDGHRMADFPHHRYAKERLAEVPFVPSPDLWVLELQLNDPVGRFGAFFEDLL